MNAVCLNDTCPELGIIKLAEHIPVDNEIRCGECWEICERTTEPWVEPNATEEVTDADPTE